MTELISVEIFNHLVELAALELDPQQAEYLRQQLNNQLNAIHELEAIPLEAQAAATSHGVPYTPAILPTLRPDEWKPWADTSEILEQAPQVEGGYIVVPEIPHTNLE